MIRLACFDLDGTLLNTLDDLHDAVAHSLAAYGLPARTLDEVRRFVGVCLSNAAFPKAAPMTLRTAFLKNSRNTTASTAMTKQSRMMGYLSFCGS